MSELKIEVTVRMLVDGTEVVSQKAGLPGEFSSDGLPTVTEKKLSQAVQAAFLQCGGVISK